MPLRIVIAPSGFKESLSPEEVADCIASGVSRALPDAHIQKIPLVDGGEGFTKALVKATGGELYDVQVTGPVGQPVRAQYGILGNGGPRTAALEMASAGGLRLVPRDARNPLTTTTYGVGELIEAAVKGGAEHLLIGLGDSGTNDGGAGMAQALGARFLDAGGNLLGQGGGELARLEHIDLANLDPQLDRIKIDVACNWHNVLNGPEGVAWIFGAQKGGSPDTVRRLALGLEHYAAVIDRDLGIDVRTMPGGGASGGLGAGLHALLGATLHHHPDVVMQYLDLDSLLREADLIITAEGGIDFQTPRGKIPVEVARHAKRYDLPVIALAGTIGKDAQVNLAHGIDSFGSILEAPGTLAEAIEEAPELLTRAAERTIRMVLVGQKLGPRAPRPE